MSNIISALVQKRKVGSPTRKGTRLFMALCASDDASGAWTSKPTMARDFEMGTRTVQVKRQAGLDGGIAIDLLPTAFVARLVLPGHLGIEPALRRLQISVLRPVARH